jgi:integrase
VTRVGVLTTLGDLNAATMASWIRAYVAGGGSVVTANQRVKALQTVWRFALRKRYQSRDDTDIDEVELARVPRRLPRAWSVAKMEAIIRSARLASGRFFGVQAAKWCPAFLLLLYETGLRMQAAFAVRFEEIDLKERLLRVPADRSATRQAGALHRRTAAPAGRGARRRRGVRHPRARAGLDLPPGRRERPAVERAPVTHSSFSFGDKLATVVVEAQSSKHRHRDELPLRPATVELLKAHLASKHPGAKAFTMPRADNIATSGVVKVLRKTA